MTEEELRQHIKAIAKPQHIWGKKHDIDQSIISLVINGRRDAPDKLLDALGLQRVIRYELAPKPRKKPTPRS